MSEINTGGGAAVGGAANAGRDIVGRDQIFVTVINQYADAAKTREEGRVQAEKLVIKWQNADPVAAEERYRQSLINHYNRLRIFGTSSEVPLQNVFTDVYIFEQPLSRIPYDFEALRTEMAEEMRPRLRHSSNSRANGMDLVKQGGNLFILGKPGAGKTTFLKYLTVQAARGNLKRLPIFVSLNEWGNSPWSRGNELQLLPFILRQFEICHFDQAQFFVEALLHSGRAIVLFDGLDEVRQEGEQRRKLIQLLKDFAHQYSASQHLITCRIAASDYVFPSFRDVEVADFSDEQISEYAELWFRTVNKSHEIFVEELIKLENAGVRELCNSPLLLSMVCLYFEQAMRFPPNRAELYEYAIEALLKNWDASRDILRDEIPRGEMIYRELSPRRKEQMFAEIAARTFEVGDYFFRRRDLARWIGDYLVTLPNVHANDDIDNYAVLRAIEAQHGIFVERAKDIYSFSHLTFQEYFTARYINERRGTTQRLFQQHLTDNRWREVFLLTVSLFDRQGADDFFSNMRRAIDAKVTDRALSQFFTWADTRATSAQPLVGQRSAVRLAYIILALNQLGRNRSALTLEIDLDYAIKGKQMQSRLLVLAQIPSLELALSRAHRADIMRVSKESTKRAHSLSIQVGFDYGLYYGWSYARLFAQEQWSRDDKYICDGMAAYPTLIEDVVELAEQAGIDTPLARTLVPSATANTASWQQFADALQAIMVQRDLVHDGQFTEKQVNQLNNYFYANELLVQCLNVAVVSDRQAILAGLLAPPQVDEGRTE